MGRAARRLVCRIVLVWVCIVVQTAKGVRKGAKIGFVFVRFWIKLLIINRFLALFLLKISPFRLIFPYCLVPALPNLSINSSLTSWYCQGGELRRLFCNY